MAYDRSQASLAPGQLLLLLAVGEAIKRGDKHLNLMQNYAYYKHRWKAEAIDVVAVQLIRRMSLHNVRASLGEMRNRWIAREKQRDGDETERDDDVMKEASAVVFPTHVQDRARILTSTALDFSGAGTRRLDRGKARTYLPFDLE